MNRNEAIKYLERKHLVATEENIEKVIQNGRIYGDPIAELSRF